MNGESFARDTGERITAQPRRRPRDLHRQRDVCDQDYAAEVGRWTSQDPGRFDAGIRMSIRDCSEGALTTYVRIDQFVRASRSA